MIHHAYIIEDKEDALELAKQNALVYDTYHILPEKNSISVEQIRNLNSEIYIKPNGDRKIYIIEAHDITVAAQNALLKTLEEPPSYAVIILIGKQSSFLSTIISRCIYIPSLNFLERIPEIRSEVRSFLNEFEECSLFEVFEHYEFLKENKDEIEEILYEFQLFFREKLIEMHNLISNVNKILEIQKAKENLKKNSNFQITIENMLITLRRL